MSGIARCDPIDDTPQELRSTVSWSRLYIFLILTPFVYGLYYAVRMLCRSITSEGSFEGGCRRNGVVIFPNQ